ncbi:tail fiber assembly protein [Pseudomonas moorei]|uniref:tail fiber assembly protein n=1 Tax=Pseudomonas moorei TaxID=395599 RepID=UPI0036F35C9D
MGSYAEIKGGIVVNMFVWDGVEPWEPPEGSVAVVVEDGSDVSIGYLYDGTVFSAPPKPIPSPAEILSANTATKDALLDMATAAIAPLQDAVDLEDATTEETARLKKWKQYRVAVNRIDLTVLNPGWPVAPA